MDTPYESLIALNDPMRRISCLLLKYGADPNLKDGDGYTPLHYLCQVYNPSQDRHDSLHLCVTSLVLCGSDLRAKTNSGRTPLEIAQMQRNTICQDAIEK